MISVWVATAVLSAALPVDAAPLPIAQASYHAQPNVRRTERTTADYSQRMAREAYCHELDRLWKEYQNAGATPVARKRYEAHVKRLRLYYTFDEPHPASVMLP